MQDPTAQRLRRIDLLFASALIALIGCSIGAGVFPLYRARTRNLAETQHLHDEIGKLGNLSLSIGRAQADIKQAELRLQSEEVRLPSSQAMDQFMTELAKVAETAGLQVDAVSPKPLVDAGNYKVMPVRISGVGSYETCCNFLTGLRNMTRLTRLDDLQLQLQHDEKSDPKAPLCEIVVNISTFVTR